MFRRVLLAAVLSTAFVAAASAATVNYTATLSGKREIPPTDSKGKGKLMATFDTKTKEFKYTLTFDGLSGPATAAHLHGPATHKENAGVMAPLGEKSPASPVSGTVTLTDDQAKALQSHKIYVNVHTAANPAGEIRGQVYARRAHPKQMATPAAAAPATTAPVTAAPTAK